MDQERRTEERSESGTVPPSSGLGRRPSLQIARRSMVINGDAQKRKEQAIQLEKVQKENQRLFSTLQKKLGALEKKIVQQQARQQTQQPRRSSYNQNRERQPLQPAAPAMFQESDARAKVANLKRRLQEKEVDLLRRRVQKLTLLAQEWQLQLLDNALATHDELNLQKSALITQSLEKLHKQLLSVQIQRANQTKPN
ncbi:hypothetical protein ACA910_012595 [Epithemia clementina (nom. ined.)]